MQNTIEALVLDLGGVIIDIDYQLAADAFVRLGIPDFDALYSKARQSSLFDDFETGRISPADFRRQIRSLLNASIADEQIDAAWNAMLIGFPLDRIEWLEKLAQRYPVFVLSNTNDIHIEAFLKLSDATLGEGRFTSIFRKCYFSSRIGMRKPDREIFDFVVEENRLDKSTTLFIDDSPQHVAGALDAGLQAALLQVEKGETLEENFSWLLQSE